MSNTNNGAKYEHCEANCYTDHTAYTDAKLLRMALGYLIANCRDGRLTLTLCEAQRSRVLSSRISKLIAANGGSAWTGDVFGTDRSTTDWIGAYDGMEEY